MDPFDAADAENGPLVPPEQQRQRHHRRRRHVDDDAGGGEREHEHDGHHAEGGGGGGGGGGQPWWQNAPNGDLFGPSDILVDEALERIDTEQFEYKPLQSVAWLEKYDAPASSYCYLCDRMHEKDTPFYKKVAQWMERDDLPAERACFIASRFYEMRVRRAGGTRDLGEWNVRAAYRHLTEHAVQPARAIQRVFIETGEYLNDLAQRGKRYKVTPDKTELWMPDAAAIGMSLKLWPLYMRAAAEYARSKS